MKSLSPCQNRFPEERPERRIPRRGAFAGLAALGGISALAPQMVQAASLTRHVETPGLKDLFTRSETNLGEYNLRFRPGDLDVAPRLRDGKPGLRLKGEFLDTELSKTESLGNNWTQTQGLRGRIQGEITTYGDNRANLNLEAFRRWEGPLSKGFQGRFEVSGGSYTDLLNSTTGMGLQFRQEIKGGDFTWAEQPLSWHLEGRQGIFHRVKGQSETPAQQYNYEFLVGLRRDFPMTVWGKPAVLSTIVGPEFHGNQDKSFEVSPKAKVRLRF